jgi:hypothetical protein
MAENMVGRAPLIPLFLAGNSTPTIPHMFSKRKDSGFPYDCADSAAADGRRGSNVYEVNLWLWQYEPGNNWMVSYEPDLLTAGSEIQNGFGAASPAWVV